MDYRKIGFGLGAFAFGAAAWTAGVALLGPTIGARRASPGSKRDDEAGAGAVPGDGTTSPIAPRPATMAAAPVGMAETDEQFHDRAGDRAAEHVPTDLMGDAHPGPGDRATAAFRPDPTAVPDAGERESLRPATGPAPTLTADRGSGFSEATGAA